MCGIAGFVGPGDQEDLAAMCGAIAHRGPDDEGFYADALGAAPVRLGFRRLAILDIAGGRQPMATVDGDLVIVFNGEIYNFMELREALEQAGHRFQTDHSDTEALLLGYRQWGEDVVERLNGMFAFCIHDRRAGRLFFGRDRFGKKPLFYAETADGLIFASEATAVQRHPAVRRDIDRDGLIKYFAYGYTPGPRTIHAGVRKLPGGHVMHYDLATRRLSTRCYWRYRMVVDDPPPGGPKQWAEEVRNLLGAAVARRLRSDVPLGFFLSGGIDSAAVTALAARQLDPASMRTFTIGFTEASYDESAFARAAAAHYGTTHAERTLDLDGAVALAPDLLARMDDPIADGSLLPTHLLSVFAREQVTVALNGDGGDELFAGYDTFAALRMARLYHRLTPGPLHRLAEGMAARLPRSDNNMSFDFKLRRALRGLGQAPSRWLPGWLGPAALSELAALFGQRLAADEVYAEADAAWADSDSRNDIDRSLEFYGAFYLGENLLIKADRASMFASLEARSPFLDKDLTAYVARLPADVKYRRGVRKWILKQALEPLVPAEILHRRKKGFGIPLSRWLRALPAPSPTVADRLGLDGDWLQRRWDEHRSGRADHRGLLWAWTALAAATGDQMAWR